VLLWSNHAFGLINTPIIHQPIQTTFGCSTKPTTFWISHVYQTWSSQPQNFHLFILIIHIVLPFRLQLHKHGNRLHFTTFCLQRQLVKCINSKHILPLQSLFSSIPIYHMPYIFENRTKEPNMCSFHIDQPTT